MLPAASCCVKKELKNIKNKDFFFSPPKETLEIIFITLSVKKGVNGTPKNEIKLSKRLARQEWESAPGFVNFSENPVLSRRFVTENVKHLLEQDSCNHFNQSSSV